ncbi:MAG: NAD(P) transhydrogenase subunit alpha [Ruminococcaceae bacterium]|nr:NAD(P) transhydrogenase subunit alpha [Oscillospiraceae bacterium]
MVIGIPKEIMHEERRVSAIPETVKKMIDSGNVVLVESGAGEGAYYPDSLYVDAGAELISDVADLYERADLILKVKEPLFNTQKDIHELDMMHRGQYLITFIHPASPANHEMVNKMARSGVIGLTLDGIPRISRAQSMDALTSMSTCAGYRGIIMAAERLGWFIPPIFSAVGSTKPANVFVVGAGVAGLQAIATAKRLGASVFACDIRPDAVEQATSLGAKIVDMPIPEKIAVAEGGYANPLPDYWILKEREVLFETVKKMDIIFLSALVPGKIAPILITEEMVQNMKPGSVIVDISIDQGGNCEITPPGDISIEHGVSLFGIKNIPGHLPKSSTWMFAKNIFNLVNYLTKDGEIYLDMNDEIVRSILVTDGKNVVHSGALEAMGVK